MTTDTTSSADRAPRGFLAEVRGGSFRFDAFDDFPPAPADGGERLAEVLSRLAGILHDPALAREIDAKGELPESLIGELRSAGFLAMRLGPEFSGLDLSPYEGFRVVESAAGFSATVGMFLAIHNALGVGSFLPSMPQRPLRDFLAGRLADGAVTGMASTEKGGAANHRRSTVAVPTPDGTGYLITGEKLFISNGAIAGVLSTTATVLEGPEEGADGAVGIFFFDTSDPGFEVVHRQRFMGLSGSPNAVVRFTRMFVPREHLLADPTGPWRSTSPYVDITTLARSYITAAVALGVAKQCLRWCAQFVERRQMDGRSLADYDAVQRLVANAAAEVFAMDSLVRFALLSGGPGERRAELDAMKNLLTMGSWRIADETLSLFAGEGYETAQSKLDRGAPPTPVEQAVRDLRGLRVAGGVDFNIDRQLGAAMLRGFLARDTTRLTAHRMGTAGAGLTERNREHLDAAAEATARLAERCRALTRRFPDEEELFARQQILISANRIGDEILAASVSLARAAGMRKAGQPQAQGLADVYCTMAESRIEGYRRSLEAAADMAREPDYARVSEDWLRGDCGWLVDGSADGGTTR